MLIGLPAEILNKILVEINPYELLQVSTTCKHLYAIANDDVIWEHVTNSKFITDHNFTDRFINFLRQIAEKVSWKYLFKLLYLYTEKEVPYFWDDLEEIYNYKNEYFEWKRAPVSVIVFTLIKKFSVLPSPCYLYLEKEHWCLLAKTLSSEPRIRILTIIRSLLHVASGKPQCSAQSMKVSTRTLTMFCELTSNEKSKANWKRECDLFMMNLLKQSHEGISIPELDNYERVTSTVLNVIIILLQHCVISLCEMAKIRNLVTVKLRSFTLKGQDIAAQLYYTVNSEHVNTSHGPMNQTPLDVLFDSSLSYERKALLLTHHDHLKVVSYKLHEYLNDAMRSPKEASQRYFFTNIDDAAKSGKQKQLLLQSVQEDQLVSDIVDRFSDTNENKRSKVKLISQLVGVAEKLIRLKNFKTFADTMEAIRGVLTFRNRTNISWCNIPYFTLRKFVHLEEMLRKHTDEWKPRKSIGHCIPRLTLYLEKSKELKIEERNSTFVSFGRNFGEYLYFDVEANAKIAEEIALIYACFYDRR